MEVFHKSQLLHVNPLYSDLLKKDYNSPQGSCIYNDVSKKAETSVFSIFYLIKKLIAPLVLPSITRSRPDNFGTYLSQEQKFKYKRVTIKTDGLSIDATLMGTADTFHNRKWILPSLGNMELYEDKLLSPNFQYLLRKSNSNAVLFNYPGAGASIGVPSSKTAVKAYLAVLRFLEDEQNGLGAKQIIGYGFSLGGGVQGEALKNHSLEKGVKKGIRYVFIKDRSFSTLEKAARCFAGFLSKLLPLLGWDLDSIQSSKRLAKLKIPEIIIQTTNELAVPISDGIISEEASHKKAIYKLNLPYKVYIDIKSDQPNQTHNIQLDSTELAESIENCLWTYS